MTNPNAIRTAAQRALNLQLAHAERLADAAREALIDWNAEEAVDEVDDLSDALDRIDLDAAGATPNQRTRFSRCEGRQLTLGDLAHSMLDA